MSASKVAKHSIIAVIVLAVSGIAATVIYTRGGLTRAERYAQHGLWEHVENELQCYLWMDPASPQANLLMAEALIKKESQAGPETVQRALAHLQCVPNDSDLSARSLTQEGRLRLFLLNQPSRAEDALSHALRIDAKYIDANYVMWKLFDLTGRSHLAEPYFWRVYEGCTAEERPLRLREWYMSQFFPVTANPALDFMMGFTKPRETPTSLTEANRLIRFRRAEPDRPVAHVAMARWFQQEGDPKYAMELLRQAQGTCRGTEDAYLVATSISVLIDLGEFDKAKEWMQRWPEPHDGYEYWLWTGMLYEQHDSDYALAATAYERAVRMWPGAVDWRTHHRLVNCLNRLGNQQRATEERQQAKQIEELSSVDLHSRLRAALGSLNDPEKLQPVVDYYAQLGREKEAACWRVHISNLRESAQRNAKQSVQ